MIGRGVLLPAAFLAINLGQVVPAFAQSNPEAERANQVFDGAYEGADDQDDDPTDIETDLDESFAKPGAIFPNVTLPGRLQYEAFKERLWENYGLRFAFSYQQLSQYASARLPFATSDVALGGWGAAELFWTPIDRGGDFEGGVGFSYAYRGQISGDPVPAVFGATVLGSIWSNYEWTSWDNGARVENLFWEQWITRSFNFRVGNQGAQAVYNFSRFKDARTSFTASPFAFQEQIPYPTFGFGVATTWRPNQTTGPYVVGTINDMNGDPAALGLNWNTFFDERQYFYGAEFGYRWTRPNGEFDHIHIDLFYADERITRDPNVLPNEAGGGFRIYGEKQMGNVVAFAGFTHNTARGGGISTTFAENTLTGGLAYLNPFGIRGEAAFGAVWSEPLEDLFPGFEARDQYGFDAYWRIQLTPNSTVTPGLQVVFDPSFNPAEDVIVIPAFKFRVNL